VIVFDHQIFCRQPYGGISRYFVETIRELLRLYPDMPFRVLAPLYINSYLERLPSAVVVGRKLIRGRRRALANLKQELNRWLASLHWRWQPGDVLHETYYRLSCIADPRQTPVVLTMFDMINELFPDQHPDFAERHAAKQAAVQRAAQIICISENTRQDLLRILPVDPKRVSVIHLGFDAGQFTSQPTGPSQIGSPYLLFVSNRAGYKNFAALLRAYAARPGLRDHFKLVCMGGEATTPAELGELARLGLEQNQVLFLRGDDALLANLYHHAAALVYPSCYEGFGIPPLEAMACDCPVICSNTSSLPEVVGEAGEYFDPQDTDALTTAIENVVGSPTRSAELRRLGRLNLQRFSWTQCAQQHMEVYRQYGRS